MRISDWSSDVCSSDLEEIRQAIGVINQVHTADSILRYAVQLTTATRHSPDLNLGASPRASLQLVRAAKSYACMAGRNYVLPDDILTMARPVLTHRLIPSVEAAMSSRDTAMILDGIVTSLPVPTSCSQPNRIGRAHV